MKPSLENIKPYNQGLKNKAARYKLQSNACC